jgi:hypothetical protein
LVNTSIQFLYRDTIQFCSVLLYTDIQVCWDTPNAEWLQKHQWYSDVIKFKKWWPYRNDVAFNFCIKILYWILRHQRHTISFHHCLVCSLISNRCPYCKTCKYHNNIVIGILYNYSQFRSIRRFSYLRSTIFTELEQRDEYYTSRVAKSSYWPRKWQ